MKRNFAIIMVYVALIKLGLKTLDSIKDPVTRQQVEEALNK
ncbi:hypothetical protein [Lachnoclostridium sp. Marseille-P6806]|nr:hypothetical protein [Lachnoclostridium sp. Marseille-P6806]